MAANGISTLSTNGVADKEKRQKAKLALAEQDRLARNIVQPGRYTDITADITQFPTQWDFNTVTNENELIDNPNTGGLKVGRPWAT
jgi:hypothetical protein